MSNRRKLTAAERKQRNIDKDSDRRLSRQWAQENAPAPVAKPKAKKLSDEDLIHKFDENAAVRKARYKFNLATGLFAVPTYLYGTHFRNMYPEAYKDHLDTITNFTASYNIPYDPQMQVFYLGSATGALTGIVGLQAIFDSAQRINLINKSRGTRLETFQDAQNYLTKLNDIDRITTRGSFAFAAVGLTVFELDTGTLPNRSFDYADMGTYAVALALYAGGLTLVAKRAINTVIEGRSVKL